MFSTRRLFRKTGAVLRQLIGTSVAGTAALTAGYVLYQKFVADLSANMTEIQIYCLTDSNVTVGIYADSSGLPGALIAQSNSVAVSATGWRSISIPGTAMAAGTNYWLAVTCSVTGGASNTAPANSGVYCYQLRAYQALPVTATPTPYANYLVAIRGFGP